MMMNKVLAFAIVISVGVDWYFLSSYQEIVSKQSADVSRMIQSNEKLVNIMLSLDCDRPDHGDSVMRIPTDIPGTVKIQPN